MSVRMIIGRSGTGKTRHCLGAIAQAMTADPLGTPIFLLLPRQATFTAERDLATAWGLPGYCRARVVSFESLGRIVLSECGGDAMPLISDVGRQMIIGHLLRRYASRLRYFGPAARHAGLAAELEATFGELERCGKDVADLDALLSRLDAQEQPSPIAAKIADLRLLYDAYVRYLGQERLDPHRRLGRVLEQIEQCKLICDSTVYVDGFLEFDESERRMVAAVARTCRHMEITVLLDPASPVVSNPAWRPGDLSLFHRAEQHYRRLVRELQRQQVPMDDPLKLEKPHRFVNPVLGRIDQHFASPRPPTVLKSSGVVFIETCDRRAEVDAAARQVKLLTRRGMRLRDIMILTRELDEYHALIDASFADHGIAHFLDRRRPAAHHPLLQLVRGLIQLAVRDWPHDAMMALLKSQLAGLTPDEADELENYVLLHRIHGPAWADAAPWAYHRELTLDESDEPPPRHVVHDLKRINALRDRLVAPLRAFVEQMRQSHAPTVRTIATTLFRLLREMKVPEQLADWMRQALEANRLEERAEHEQVWNELVELIEQMVDLLGDEPVTPGQFAEILDVGLERFDLALIPQTVDQVLIGSLDRTRGGNPRAVILLGMNDGQFPRAPRQNAILGDSDRGLIAEAGIDLEPDSARRLLDENLLGYIALTRASDHLCLIRACSDEANRPQSPSLFWRKLRQMLPDAPIEYVPRNATANPARIGTPRQLITCLMDWIKSRRDDDSPPPPHLPALYQWLAGLPDADDPVTTLRRKAWRALSYANDARLSPEVASELFKSPLRASVSRLETFASCPFKHFAQYGLGLKKREDPDVTALDLGNLYHSVLDQLVRALVAERADLTRLDHARVQQLIKTISDKVSEQLRGELMLSTARNKYLLQRVGNTVEQVMRTQEAVARRGAFRPWRTELAFGQRQAELPSLRLNTPGGNIVELHGKIDRVDLIEREAAFAVLDYKLRGDKLSMARVYHGLSLQLLTYLLVLQAQGDKLAGKPLTPAAAFYVTLLRKLERTRNPDEALAPSDPLFHLQHKQRGVFDRQYIAHLDRELAAGETSDVVQASIKKDGNWGDIGHSDAVEANEFRALMRFVRRQIMKLVDQVLRGNIAVAPYLLGKVSPCPGCDYRSVCRFEVAVNRYRPLENVKKTEVLARIIEEVDDGA